MAEVLTDFVECVDSINVSAARIGVRVADLEHAALAAAADVAIPMRHVLEISRRVLLKGATVGDIAPQLGALAILGAVILSLSVVLFRRRLT